ncbi:hypothetical protein FHS27_006548 [Rhodopirellula rubra]|uniref:Leucine Rich repeats (2 copies) n=1 Tax=Aporhodopirellula rubra TaxID=980271 RepID=A0A7W5HA20_9BACT|nr:hypothetical protein [Aporhodopirellula rubra]MBB3210700.1 hypothetical protein [Aporhodopirellula rubra]
MKSSAENARKIVEQLGGSLNGTSVYLDEASERVTDTDIETILVHLKNLPKFSLGVADSDITDQTLHRLSAYPNLVDLCLTGTSVTDAGVRSLSDLHNLKSLILNETAVTDAGLASLHGLPNLARLGLGPNVTDQSVDTLHSFPNLRWLILEPRQRCQFTDTAFATIKSEMQSVHILLGGSDPNSDNELV